MKVQKISCSEDLKSIECINPRRDRWAFHWSLHETENEGWYAYEAVTDHRPSISEIREVIEKQIDEETQCNIVNGFFWNGINIVLTESTQRNFLFAAYAANHTGAIDRDTFAGLIDADKSDEEATSILSDIVCSMWKHIKDCRAEGEAQKQNIDYSGYE